MPTPHLDRDPHFLIERYGPHESVVTVEATAKGGVYARPVARPGDFLLTHSTGVYGFLIRFGEALRYRGQNRIFAHWSHAAIIVDESGSIIEALGGGVQERNLVVYCKTEYVVVHLPSDTSTSDRLQAVEFARFCLNEPYGWMTIASVALSLLTSGTLSFGIDGQQICSALVARCLERIGVIFRENEPWHLMPADLAKHFDVRAVGEKGQAPNHTEKVVQFSKPGGRRKIS